MSIHDDLGALREEAPTAAQALQRISREKAREVARQWDKHPSRNMDGTATFHTRAGKATIGSIRYHPDDDRLDSVEVWTGPQQGPPQYRLINPPMLVPDSRGEVVLNEVNKARGKTTARRYRIDPLVAIAEFIASHQGGKEKG